VLNNVFVPLCLPQLLGQTLERSAEALRRAERVGDPVLIHIAAEWRAEAAARAGDVDEMDRCLERAEFLVNQLGQPIFTWGLLHSRAQRALIEGDPDEAERLATEALQIGTESGQPDAAIFFSGPYFTANLERGTLGGMVDLIQDLASQSPEIPSEVFAAITAIAHSEGGRIDEARRVLNPLNATGFTLRLDRFWATALACCSEATIECRLHEYAEPLFNLLAPLPDQLTSIGSTTADGTVSHFLGGLAALMGRYDEAEHYFQRAAALNDQMRAKFFTARTNLSWGRMLLDRKVPGDVERARELLLNAAALAASHGYAMVERRARHDLQRAP
jgi:tetratricopeptide (TPR) repeat protein